MKLFGLILDKETNIKEEMREAYRRGRWDAKNEFWREEKARQKRITEKLREANVVITKIELVSEPYFERTMFIGGDNSVYHPAEYLVTFHTTGGELETDITLKFDDPDVSISKIKRAIHAKICGGGCCNDE